MSDHQDQAPTATAGLVVYGADFAAGHVDLAIGWAGGTCGGDSTSEFVRIRDGGIASRASACGDCAFDEADDAVEDYLALLELYEGRDGASFPVGVAHGGWDVVVSD